MPTINEISISYATLLGFNGMAALALWTEYATSRQPFVRYAFVGQLFILCWHAVNLTLVFAPDALSFFYLSSFFLGVSGFCFLAASANHSRFNFSVLATIAAIYCATLLLDYGAQIGLIGALRLLTAFAFFAAPLLSIVCIKGGFRFLIATLQLFAAVTAFTSLALVYGDYVDVGALLYLLAGLLIPIASICFLILSTNLSRQRILESERKYRVFFESVDEVFFEMDAKFVILNLSPSITQFGFEREQLLGKSVFEYLVQSEDFTERAENALENSEAFQCSNNFITDNGPVDCDITCSPIRIGAAGPVQFAGTIRNTHDRNLLERQFINAQRHESLGKLAGGIAHDFNNLLQGILGHAELLKQQEQVAGQQRTSLDAIVKGAASAGGLCRQLLLYTGTGSNLKEDFELTEQIAEIADIIRPSLTSGGELQICNLDMPCFVRGDKAQIGQVIMNLVKNAIESRETGVNVHLRLALEQVAIPSGLGLQASSNLQPGTYVKLQVMDDGSGIEPGILTKIFDPFFTTKEKGHGLGLAAIVGILAAHDGAITVESELGKGTTFNVWLPLMENPNVLQGGVTPRSGEVLTILHVDDEQELLRVGKGMLEQMGHTVFSTSSAESAMAMLAKDADCIDLLLTDIKMPGMDGISLMRNVLELYPQIALVLASGYADVTSSLTVQESLRVDFLGKPYSQDELSMAIDNARTKSRMHDCALAASA